ncbi:MAG: triose-phosphate isomerase [Proteobacteria bacterium]|nr:triose-phosphate isomerase [Pseudomonadota bacterium]MBU2226746.1 triose-phosphate isomerase [Pseudomonadota bacterium]MBU2261231.1 triose-phosphate isomerase [Pseudomonadota bacterium]
MIESVIAGNWKMNKTIAEAVGFASRLREALGASPGPEVIVAPPFTALRAVAEVLRGSAVRLAAQNLHEAEKGAYTGEISGGMLREAGCQYVIIGHSERRTLFSEGNDAVNLKLRAALAAGLKPIFCIGETLREREEDRTKTVIERQLKEGLNNLTAGDIGRSLFAYEPVWAIGTGRTATPEQAEEVHRFIREWIAGQYGRGSAEELAILYGGSVTPANIASLMLQQDINGALVGGASLDVESFLQVVRYNNIQEV